MKIRFAALTSLLRRHPIWFCVLVGCVLGAPSLLVGQSGASQGWGGAAWVWDQPDAHQTPQTNDPRYLRRGFTLPAKAEKAELWITADNHYVAYINGQKVGEDGEWSTVERYDVSKLLTTGKNVLAIKATNQGGPAGVIARLYVKTADKKETFVVTDEQMKITQTAAKDWNQIDFNDSGWFAAIVLGDASIGPWSIAGNAAASAQGLGKGPKAYGFSDVDNKVKNRLTGVEQLKHFVVPKDFAIELVAADPVVINPITMTLDDKSRIIVSESHTYRYGPSGSPIKPYANPVVRLDPDGKGGFSRTLVADGFVDPVMGIAVKQDKLWLTACDFLYQYDLLETAPKEPKKGEGVAVNRRLLLADKNHAWNPFGMFVLEWGPEGKLYMSVGNHNIDIEGPDGKISARGGSGLVMRMNPDATKMERLVHGLRVPYSFDYDPFGQLWQLSNGEGNPDRFVRVIDGVDYHCYSRGSVDNNWLAGNHPLAPPCEEVHGGAHTQFMRYFAAAYPAEYQGNLFACNWGRHGFAGANRGIFRFVLDERNNILKKDTLVACTDPHFRPSHIILDPDGNLLIADWYGRDDESDMTGRIWRLKYVGADRPVVKHQVDSNEWTSDYHYALSALGSPSHVIRQKATQELLKHDYKAIIKELSSVAATSKEPLGAAQSLWTLLQLDGSKERNSLRAGASHPDWRVRRLAMNLLRRYAPAGAEETARFLHTDQDPAVTLEAALGYIEPYDRRVALFDALERGAAKDVHLRYETAWHLAMYADEEFFQKMLTSSEEEIRLAGLIAIDVACWENFPTKKVALAALARAIENPGKLDQQLLLMVAHLDGDASLAPALEKLIARHDIPIATTAKAILLLKIKAGGLAQSFSAAAGKRLIEAVEKGALRIASAQDQLVLFEFLEAEGPTPFALKQIEGQLRSNQPMLRQSAHLLARRFGPQAAPLAEGLWPSVQNPKTKFEDAIDYLSTIARIEKAPKRPAWFQLLEHNDPLVRMEAVRWWRHLPGKLPIDMTDEAIKLLEKDSRIADDLGMVQLPSNIAKQLNLPGPEKDKDALTKYALKEVAAISPAERPKRAAMGQQVFERNACTKCHTTATQTTLLAPSLKGIAGQKLEYLIESVLFPSKIIKTGFESETVTTTDGKTLQGLVKDEGKTLRVLNLDKDIRIPKSDVESRSVSRVSIMPEGQEAQLSRRELVDLIVYLATLK